MDKDVLLSVIALFGAIVASKKAMGLLIKMFDYLTRRSRTETYIKMMEHLRSIQDGMRDICDQTAASRVVIFSGHNGGGLPRPSSRYYTTAVHWEVEDEYSLAMADYKNIPVDQQYISMLLDSYEKDSCRMETSKMVDCHIKRIYEAEKITDSLVFFLDVHENNFIYASIATKDLEGYHKDDVTKIEVLACKLRDVVRLANKDN